MKSLSEQFPDVRLVANERLMFEVQSRSGRPPWKVDKEANNCLGECRCEAYQKNKTRPCYHLNRLNAFLATSLAMEILERELAK